VHLVGRRGDLGTSLEHVHVRGMGSDAENGAGAASAAAQPGQGARGAVASSSSRSDCASLYLPVLEVGMRRVN